MCEKILGGCYSLYLLETFFHLREKKNSRAVNFRQTFFRRYIEERKISDFPKILVASIGVLPVTKILFISTSHFLTTYEKKVQVYSLMSSLKTYHPTSHLTPWSLDLFICEPFQLHGEHTVLQPFRRIEFIVHIAISVLPGTHFHLSQVKHLRVKCLAQGHIILTMAQDWEGRNMMFLWKFYTKRYSKPHGRQRHRQSDTL